MKIPQILVNEKYYVAESDAYAYSSWDSLEKAMDCITQFNNEGLDDAKKIIGIIKVDSTGANLVFKPAILSA
jgi:hypothetical protein